MKVLLQINDIKMLLAGVEFGGDDIMSGPLTSLLPLWLGPMQQDLHSFTVEAHNDADKYILNKVEEEEEDKDGKGEGYGT